MRFFAVLIVAISTLFVVKRLSSEKGSPVGATTYKKHSDARKDRKVSVGSRMKVSEKDLKEDRVPSGEREKHKGQAY